MMIGRAPTMVPQQYAQPQYAQPPMQTYPGQQYGQAQQAPLPWPPPRVGQNPATSAPQVATQNPGANAPRLATPPITARGKPYEDPPELQMRPPVAPVRIEPINMPSPEELGVTPIATTPMAAMPAPRVDWNAAHERLQRVGGVGLQVAQVSENCHRVGFVLRTNQTGQVHHIEATAATQAEAVAVALDQAERWASGR